jgi:N-acetylneuraminic acid mutarotase
MRGVLAPLVLAGALATAGCSLERGGDELRSASSRAWTPLAPATLARTEVSAARGGRYVYVVGGFERESGASSAVTERYDLERDRWARVAAMPVPLNHAAAVAYRGDVYVLGGYRARGGLAEETAALHRYDPERNRWTALASAPTARGALAAGVIGHRLYAAGGANAGGVPLATLEVYDFRTGRWRAGPGMRVPREHLAGAVAAGRFYALAGRAAGQGNFRAVEAFDPAAGRWRPVPAMRKARGGIAAATVGRSIVVVGGEEGAGTIREVEAYDPRKRAWRRLPGLRTPRHGLGAVARGRRVYAIEGGDRPGFAFTDALEVLTVGRP